MIKFEPCIGCGRMVLVSPIANLVAKCDPTPLVDVGEIVRLLTSPNPPGLWMVERNQQGQPTRLRGARPGEPGPVREHRCPEGSRGPLMAPQTAGPAMPPKAPSPPAAPSRRSSGQRTGSSTHDSAPDAATPASRSHPCDACGKPVALDGPELYTAIELGAAPVWAVHQTCP